MRRSAAILLIAAASGVHAQRGTDYGRPVPSPENQADGALRGAARCTFQEVPASTRKVLETGVGSTEEAKRVKGLVGVARSCFQPQWPAFPPTAFRDALAEVSYREAFQFGDPTPVQTTPPDSFAVVPAGTTGTPDQEATWQVAALAACTVFASPTEARAWITGPRNVAEEERRFAAVRPGLARCGGDAATKVLTARYFRGPVANALLERATRAQKAK